MSNTTIRVLAQKLGLSIGTVSKALRDSHEISSDTKEKVLALARQLNYVPNPYASSLRKRRSKTIAVVLPEVADSFFSLAINGIEAVAQEKGYHVLIYLTHESFVKEINILKDFQSGRVDGILLSVSDETSNSDHVKEVIAAGIPVVFFDRICEDVDTARVITDDFESSYNATSHLLQKGCERIAYLSISANLSISTNRMEGYKKALEDQGASYDPCIIQCSNDMDDNSAIIRNILNNAVRPDGIIASVEKLTATVYMVCRELKLSIPDKIRVVSFTNLQTAAILNPALTTVTQPAFEMGKTAATVLFKALGKNSANLKKESVIIPSLLVKRDSTD
jgi:LacI family transcriptional regulator